MFDIFAMLLSSVATFLFPVFASYKALNTADPALLKPWLMYWVVLACTLLAESWVGWILVWFPFYSWIRAAFLLWLILPQTQGARQVYEIYLHPFLRKNENAIDDFISSAHERAKSAGLSYLKQLIELAKQHLLGLPPKEAEAPPPPTTMSYAQSLLARFNLPAAKPTFAAAGTTGSDVYSLLANAVAAYAQGSPSATTPALVPQNIRGTERKSFIEAQRERLNFLLKALEREAAQSTPEDIGLSEGRTMQYDGQGLSTQSNDPTAMGGMETHRNISSAGLSEASLAKSLSVGDFEKIDEMDEGLRDARTAALKQRPGPERTASGGSWMPWAWGAKNPVEKVEEVVGEEGKGKGELREERSVDELKDGGKGKSSAIDSLM